MKDEVSRSKKRCICSPMASLFPSSDVVLCRMVAWLRGNEQVPTSHLGRCNPPESPRRMHPNLAKVQYARIGTLELLQLVLQRIYSL